MRRKFLNVHEVHANHSHVEILPMNNNKYVFVCPISDNYHYLEKLLNGLYESRVHLKNFTSHGRFSSSSVAQ